MSKCPHRIADVIAAVKAHPKYNETTLNFKQSLDRWNGMSVNPYYQKKHNRYIRHVWSHFYLDTRYIGPSLFDDMWPKGLDMIQ